MEPAFSAAAPVVIALAALVFQARLSDLLEIEAPLERLLLL